MPENGYRSDPESNPVPYLPSLPPPSASNPIGLILSQEIGSPERSYVSELDKNTHRNNLVAEKVTWVFVEIRKNTFLQKQALC